MGCKIKFEDLSRYADGRCMQKEAAEISEHLKICHVCSQKLHSLHLMKESASGLEPVTESEGFDFAFNQKLKEKISQQGKPKFGEILDNAAEKIARGLKEAFMPKVPVLVKVFVALLIVIGTYGGYNYHIINQLPTIKSIKGSAEVYNPSSGRWVLAKMDMKLKGAYRIRTDEASQIDILSGKRYAARIKENSDIVIAKLQTGLLNQHTEFEIRSGRLMVNTRDKFKGSDMQLSTATCKAKVVGTAFVIDVNPALEGATWIGVLEGKVKVASKAGTEQENRVVFVNSGQKAIISPDSLPSIPTLLSDMEWKITQELYQLGEKPQVVLLVSMRPNRVQELLRPAYLYIADEKPRTVPKNLEKVIDTINKAIKNNDIRMHTQAIKSLEGLVREHPNPKYNAQFLMFTACYYYYIEDYNKAIQLFSGVVKEYPGYSLASLAQCAIATIYKKNLRDNSRAKAAFEKLLKEYPNSIDAIRAKRELSKIK